MVISYTRLIFVVLTALVFSAATIRAQVAMNTTPVDFYHPGSAALNPAIIPFQDEQLAVGTQALHAGFLGGNAFSLRHDMFHVSLPAIRNWNLGFGLRGEHLNTPIFKQNRLGIQAAFLLRDDISCGVNIGFLNQSFDQDEFQLVDENDPVFSDGSSVFVADAGLGFVYQRDEKWRYGLAFDHVNQPDISLAGAGEKLPFEVSGAVLYRHKFLETTLGLRVTGSRAEPLIEFASSLQGIGMARTGFYGSTYTAGGQLYLSNKFSIDYQYAYSLTDLNKFSSGSHKINFVYRFGKTPDIEYTVRSLYDSLRISERFVTQWYDDVFTAKDQVVSQKMVSHGRFDAQPQAAYYRFVPLDSIAPIPEIDFNAYLDHYQSLIENLVAQMKKDDLLHLRVIVPLRKKRVASAFVHHLQKVYGIAPEKLEYGWAIQHDEDAMNGHSAGSTSKLSTHQNLFTIAPDIKRKYNRFIDVSEWRLRIIDSGGSVLKEFIGQFNLPERIHWDWKAESGELLKAGNYYYYLQWRDKRGASHRSPSQKLSISKYKRDVNIEVTKVSPNVRSISHRIDIVLGL
ncbi:MAG: type IX secretion system membrane protein PorP/SprF [Calditrichaeota bacterium]|nr:MAG: type IX secretion system membrane protein PorP/SprF [Calditrichota bacterium]